MKAKVANPRRLDILGNGDCSSDQEILNTLLKKWRRKLGYCSIFVAVPAVLTSHISEARSDEAKKPDPSVAGQRARRPEKLNMSCSSPALLKLQSEFVLPHQKGSFAMLTATLAGNDDCPGRIIPGGNYTAAAPYIDSGDTTGANNTVTRPRYSYYCYYSHFVPGSDHVYSFTLTGRGANPQIQVSRTSGPYEPVAYILDSRESGGCPASTGNEPCGLITFSGSSDGSATIRSEQLSSLPLNVPLHLFVDSIRTDASGSGPYTIRIQDVTIVQTNTIDHPEFFVRQNYQDFLSREPDPAGLNFWTNEITGCGSNAQCVEHKRINVSAAFFLSIEFQESGYLVHRMYKAAYGDMPGTPVPMTWQEFLPDTYLVKQGVVVGWPGWEQRLVNNKNGFANEFVARSRFTTAFPQGMSYEQFVDTLNANAGGVLSQSERNQLISDLASDRKTRAQVLWSVAENSTLAQREFNKAFVLMQYFGYLHRNPNEAPDSNFAGYDFWLNKMNQFNGDFVAAEMVKAFITSGEYKQRFGP
jgi:Domain of unknown function (DUF4214)